MSENKYHTSRSGFLTACSASKRACPRKGVHFTQSEYDNLAANQDVRIRPNPSKVTKDKEGYYKQAEKAYMQANTLEENYKKINKETAKYKARLFRQNGLKAAQENSYYPKLVGAEENMLRYAREAYIKAGVSYGKAGFIVQDMKNKQDPTKPIVKRKDRYDENLNEKTKNAAKALAADAEYAKLTKIYREAKEKYDKSSQLSSHVAQRKYEQMRSKGIIGTTNHQKEVVTEQFQQAKAWLNAGIPAEAKEHHIAAVTPAMISVDPDGRINNVWAEHNGKVQRVVGYVPSNGNYGSSGKMVTESGDSISQIVHYHSYRREEGGTSKLIIANKKGATHPATGFNLVSEIDTGD